MIITIYFIESQVEDNIINFDSTSFNDETTISIHINETKQQFSLRNPNILSYYSQLALENAYKGFSLIESYIPLDVRAQAGKYLKILLMPSIYRAYHDFYRLTYFLRKKDIMLLDHQIDLVDNLLDERAIINNYFTGSHSKLSIHFLENLLTDGSLMNYSSISENIQSPNNDLIPQDLVLIPYKIKKSTPSDSVPKTAFFNGCGMRTHYFKALPNISHRSKLFEDEINELIVNYTFQTPSLKKGSSYQKNYVASNLSNECIKNGSFLAILISNIINTKKKFESIIKKDSLRAVYVSDLINVYTLLSIDLAVQYKKQIVVASHSGGPLLFRRYSRYCTEIEKLYLELPVACEGKFNYIVPINIDKSFTNILSEDYPVSNIIEDDSLVFPEVYDLPNKSNRLNKPKTLIIACEFYLGSFYSEDYLVLLIKDVLQTVQWALDNQISVTIRFRGTHQLVIPALLQTLLNTSSKEAHILIKDRDSLDIGVSNSSLIIKLGWNSKASTRAYLCNENILPILLVIGRSSSVMLEGYIAQIPVLYFCRDQHSYFIEEHRVCYAKFLINLPEIKDIYAQIQKLFS